MSGKTTAVSDFTDEAVDEDDFPLRANNVSAVAMISSSSSSLWDSTTAGLPLVLPVVPLPLLQQALSGLEGDTSLSTPESTAIASVDGAALEDSSSNSTGN